MVSNEVGLACQDVLAYIGTEQDYLLGISVHQVDWGLVLPDNDSLTST